MTRTVAIYGFSPKTRNYIHDSEATEVWTLNNAWKHDTPMERVTRWYELHDLDLYGEVTPDRWAWLREKHPFPVYMHKQHEQFPSSVKFPKDEIVQFVGREYFTNSIAWMIAHAAYESVDRLEIYGVDMDFGTEYAYQKAGTEYMIRLAESAGVEIYLPPGCSLLNDQLYGFDGYTQLLPIGVVQLHIKYYSDFLEKLSEIYLPLVERHKSGDKSAIHEIVQMNPQIWRYDGAASYLRELVNATNGRGVIKRQDLEHERVMLMNALAGKNADMNYLKGSINKAYSNAESIELEDTTRQMHNHDGAIQAVNKLIREIDHISYDMELNQSTSEAE